MLNGIRIIGLRNYIEASAQQREAGALGAVVMFFLVAALLMVLEWRNRISQSERFRRGFLEKQATANNGKRG
jgi:hypothetical protein